MNYEKKLDKILASAEIKLSLLDPKTDWKTVLSGIRERVIKKQPCWDEIDHLHTAAHKYSADCYEKELIFEDLVLDLTQLRSLLIEWML